MGSIDSGKDAEGGKNKLPYPKSVLFILVCEFCERFCYYGMRTILTLYFVQVLSWSDDTASVIYHAYIVFAYFTPIMGAVLADSWLGKFRTIFYLAVVYCIGCVVISLASVPPLKIPTMAFSMIGLALIAIGTGGIKPCVSAFGADQFQLPEQEVQLASFFAIFYFAINSGSLISTVLTPILREDVQCFGDDHCYPLAFAVPAALMIFALAVFLLAKPMYKVNDPEGNVMAQVFGAIKHSFSRKKSEIQAGRTREHWLDYADDKYDKRFLEEAKVLLKVLFLYIPLPFFWSLFDQQGSRWTLQASRMDGDTWGWVIKPDQMQVINPLVVLALIPLFDQVFYPILAKFNLLKKPLQRLTVGGIFAGIAFVVSGIIELTLEPSYATVLKSGQSNIHFINGLNCSLPLTINGYDGITLDSGALRIFEAVDAREYTVDMVGCDGKNLTQTINAVSEEARSFMAVMDEGKLKLLEIEEEDDMEKADNGNPRARVIHYGLPGVVENATLHGVTEKYVFDFILRKEQAHTEFGELEREAYDVSLISPGFPNGSLPLGKQLNMELGAVYIISVVYIGDATTSDPFDSQNYQVVSHEITKPSNVHILLLLPQYIIMSMGEIMFSITIMDFSYAEGPPSMKSVMQSAWLLTVAVGNVIDVIIISVKFFDEQSKEFFLFAGLMFVDMLIFSYMAYKYVPADRFWLREDNQPGDKKESMKALEGNDNAGVDKDDD